MTGLILCGGESSRMGTDKGMIVSQGSNWAQSIANLFSSLNIPFYVSINNTQKENYREVFEPRQLILDNPILKAKGPLSGLLSCHKTFPNDDILVLACDMIDMQLPPLQLLLDNYLRQSGFAVYLFKTGDRLQPLCAIYTAAFLDNISNRLSNGDSKRFGLTFIVEATNNLTITAPIEWINYFNNYNSPEDLSFV